jgi:hypothetical protein
LLDEVISCGANVPFADKVFWPIMEDVDHKISLIQTLYLVKYGSCFLFHVKKYMTDEAIFHDTSEIIKSNRKNALNNETDGATA